MQEGQQNMEIPNSLLAAEDHVSRQIGSLEGQGRNHVIDSYIVPEANATEQQQPQLLLKYLNQERGCIAFLQLGYYLIPHTWPDYLVSMPMECISS